MCYIIKSVRSSIIILLHAREQDNKMEVRNLAKTFQPNQNRRLTLNSRPCLILTLFDYHKFDKESRKWNTDSDNIRLLVGPR